MAIIKLGDFLAVDVESCQYGNGITLEGHVLQHDESLGEIPDALRKKFYLRLDTGGYNYALPKEEGWMAPPSQLDSPYYEIPKELQKPINYFCFRLPQHERRYWQSGFPVYFGYLTGAAPFEIQLEEDLAKSLSINFD